MILGELSINGMAVYAEVAMVIFLVIFAGVGVWALRRSTRELNTWARLPLDETHTGEPDTKI